MNNKEKILSIVSYIGPLSIVVYLFANNKDVTFHSKQAIRLFIYTSILLIITLLIGKIKILWRLSDIIFSVIILLNIFLSVQGIQNAINNKKVKLPLINKVIKMTK